MLKMAWAASGKVAGEVGVGRVVGRVHFGGRRLAVLHGEADVGDVPPVVALLVHAADQRQVEPAGRCQGLPGLEPAGDWAAYVGVAVLASEGARNPLVAHGRLDGVRAGNRFPGLRQPGVGIDSDLHFARQPAGGKSQGRCVHVVVRFVEPRCGAEGQRDPALHHVQMERQRLLASDGLIQLQAIGSIGGSNASEAAGNRAVGYRPDGPCRTHEEQTVCAAAHPHGSFLRKTMQRV